MDNTTKAKRDKGPFQKLGLSKIVCKAIFKAGYQVPTKIQRRCIPVILEGQDVAAMARTGSGKTAAFLLPIIDMLEKHSLSVGCRSIIISPTRELALQTWRFARDFCAFTDLRLCSLIGGGAMDKQFAHLARNPDIIIACPGRLIHQMVETSLKLSAVKHVVFDEADRLFELGFASQLQKLLHSMPPGRQCILTSATMPSQLVDFSRAKLRSPVLIRLDVEHSLSDNLNLSFVFMREEERESALLFLLKEVVESNQSSAVFVATRHHVEYLGLLLARLSIPHSLVYGTMDNFSRRESLSSFSRGCTKVLVVTDLAARGVDIPILDNVIHYDFPATPKLFVHRTGRTARAGRGGSAFAFVTLSDLPYVYDLSLFLGRPIVLPPTQSEATKGASTSNEESSHRDIDVRNTECESAKFTVMDEKSFDDEFGATATTDGIHQSSSTIRLRGVSDLSAYLELIHKELEENMELQKARNSVSGACKMYNKTKKPASRHSVRRAKELVNSCRGDVSHVAPEIDPNFAAAAKMSSTITTGVNREKNKISLIEHLKSFRPKTDKKYTTLPVEVVQKMNFNLTVSKMNSFEESAQEKILDGGGKQGQAVDAQSRIAPERLIEMWNKVCNKQKSLESPEESALQNGIACGAGLVSIADPLIPKSSKRRRTTSERRTMKRRRTSNGKQGGDEMRLPSFPDNGSKRLETDKTAKTDFYLSDEISNETRCREFGHELDAARLDILPDDHNDFQKITYARKWNEKRKRYQIMAVDVEGRKLKRKNESGVVVRGEVEEKGLYRKWQKKTMCRIQAVGEEEDPDCCLTTNAKPKKTLTIIDEKKKDDKRKPGDATENSKTDKPAQWKELTDDTALIEALQRGKKLTHKQQRKLQKLKKLKEGVITYGDKSNFAELTPAQIAKKKKDEQVKRAKWDTGFRKKLNMRNKSKHMTKKSDQMAMRGAKPRSFFIVSTSNKHKKKK